MRTRWRSRNKENGFW